LLLMHRQCWQILLFSSSMHIGAEKKAWRWGTGTRWCHIRHPQVRRWRALVVPLGAMEILCGDEVLIFCCLDIHLDGMCTYLHIIVSPDGLITNWYYGVLAYFSWLIYGIRIRW
jgi:hypothetical protein